MMAALEFLRGVVEANRILVERLHDAHARCDPDSLRELLDQLDLNAADLALALEELNSRPPPKNNNNDVKPDEGDAGPTTLKP